MTTDQVKVDVPGAQGTYGPASAEVNGNRGVVGPDGVRPGLGTTLSGMSTNYNGTVDGTTRLTGQGGQFANGFGEADRAGAAKAEAAPKGPVDPSSAANAPKVGADKFASRLTPNDLLKLASSPYQSAMPLVQSVPSAAQSIPSLLNAPLQAAQAPIQAMLAGPGGAPMLDQILARGNASNGFDGGPASLALPGSTTADGVKLNSIAKSVLGMPYAWGGGHGANPGPSQGISDGGGPADRAGDYRKVGLDCSGLARYVTAQMYGIDIGGTSESQYASGTPVSASQARPGDLVFPASAGRPPGHVAVLMPGGSSVLEAPSSGQTVKISPLPAGAEFRRFVTEA